MQMRLDEALVERALVKDLKTARGLILAGKVLVDDQAITSAAFEVNTEQNVRTRNTRQWVSRSALKLLAAIDDWHIKMAEEIVLDVGASTGGFTQVLLTKNVARVIAIDVAYGFLQPALREDARVTVLERTNICSLAPEDIKFLPGWFVMDVSFINPVKVLLHLKKMYEKLNGLVLFKPQFYAKKSEMHKGVVTDENILKILNINFQKELEEAGISVVNTMPAAIKGSKGNQEFMYQIEW